MHDDTTRRSADEVLAALFAGGYIWHLGGCNRGFGHAWGKSRPEQCTCGLAAVLRPLVPIHGEDCRG